MTCVAPSFMAARYGSGSYSNASANGSTSSPLRLFLGFISYCICLPFSSCIDIIFITGPATPGRRQLARIQHANSLMLEKAPLSISRTTAFSLFSPDAITLSGWTFCISSKVSQSNGLFSCIVVLSR